MSAGRSSDANEYNRLTIKSIVQLAAPHTWPAAILPVLLAVTLVVAKGYMPSLIMTLVLLTICILMQSSVNTFNDYFDFVKGADSADNQTDPTDAALVYNNINPRAARTIAVLFLVFAFLLGIYVVYQSGVIPLFLGLLGALIIVLYSAGKTPLSYLPLGELVSGVTMGMLITLACYYALSGNFDFWVILFSLPLVCGIGLIMMTNNTCDIEKDRIAGRKTLSALIGRKKARTLYHLIIMIWIVLIVLLASFFFTSGLLMMPFMLITLYPTLSALWNNPLTLQTRVGAMVNCLNLNIGLGLFYCLAISIGSHTLLSL